MSNSTINDTRDQIGTLLAEYGGELGWVKTILPLPKASYIGLMPTGDGDIALSLIHSFDGENIDLDHTLAQGSPRQVEQAILTMIHLADAIAQARLANRDEREEAAR